MRRLGWMTMVSVLLAIGGPRHLAWAKESLSWVELDCPEVVMGERRIDVDGDGVLDLVLLAKNNVLVWKGIKGALPSAKSSWQPTWPPSKRAPCGFVDLVRRDKSLVVLHATQRQLHTVAWNKEGHAIPDPVDRAIAWEVGGGDNICFGPLCDDHGGHIEPQDGSYRYVRPGHAPIVCRLEPYRHMTMGGQFLGESNTATTRYPSPFFGAPPRALGVRATAGKRRARPSCLWVQSGEDVIAQTETQRTHFDAGALLHGNDARSATDLELVDLNGDGRPELFHRHRTNRSGVYRFFEIAALAPSKEKQRDGPPLQKSVTKLSLTGAQLRPTLTDLNGDGLLDLVVTTIAIDGRNTLRAMGKGTVTAETRGYLHVANGAPAGSYPTEPSALIRSDIQVAIRFTYGGNIKVNRSFTIVEEGDFNGDGRGDLAIREVGDSCSIWLSSEDGLWKSETPVKVKIPPIGDHTDVDGYAADLTGDGRDELLLIYRAGPGGRDRTYVISIAK